MKTLEFGSAVEDITPKIGLPLCGYFNLRPNRGYYDRLKLKAAVFRTGDSVAAIVSYDLCLLTRPFIDEMEKALEAENSPLCGKVLYCATHTHTGPYSAIIFGAGADEEYMAELKEKSLSALHKAYASLSPAELFTTQTECSTMAFNRRYVMKNGQTLTNPGKLNPDIVRPEGGIDEKIMLMEIRRDGRPEMIIANISNHTDTIGGDIVSADWPGIMEFELQRMLELQIPVMTIIAPQGNINHFNTAVEGSQTGYEEAKRIGKTYANVIAGARYQLKKQENCDIVTASSEFEAPYYQLNDEEYAAAKKVYEENKDATMEEGRDFTSEDIARGVPFVKKYFAERAISCRENPITEKRIEKQLAIMFGSETAIVSLPAEPFIELGVEIRKNSRFPMTVIAALGMGEVGYVGMPYHYGHGGYETSPDRTLAAPTVGERMIAGARELLK